MFPDDRSVMKFLWVPYLLFIASGHAYAVPKPPIHVQADHMTYDGQRYCGHYQGHVQVIQGDMHLFADSASTQLNAKNELVHAQAAADIHTSKLTHFWTKIKPSDPWFHAYAQTIEYQPREHRLILKGQAHIHQGQNHMYAPTIIYDLKYQHLTTLATQASPTIIQLYPESTHE